jgi:hypothetical protein
MPASWYKQQPTNRNYLSPLGFQFKLETFEGVDFFCQQANLPEVQMPFTEVPTRFRNIPVTPGGGVTYGDLTLQFIVDEDLVNYNSVVDWIKRNGGAEGHEVDEIEFSQGALLITTSHFNVKHVVEFDRMFPVSITGLTFDATQTDQEYFTAAVTFKYTSFRIRTSTTL